MFQIYNVIHLRYLKLTTELVVIVACVCERAARLNFCRSAEILNCFLPNAAFWYPVDSNRPPCARLHSRINIIALEKRPRVEQVSMEIN